MTPPVGVYPKVFFFPSFFLYLLLAQKTKKKPKNQKKKPLTFSCPIGWIFQFNGLMICINFFFQLLKVARVARA
jgi:hypothetical protein